MKKRLILVTLIMMTASATASQVPKNFLTNPGFEQGLKGWETTGQAEFAADHDVKHSGKQSARITVSQDQQLEWQQIGWSRSVKPGEEYVANFWVKCDLKDGFGAYGVIEFLRDKERVGIVQSFPTRGRTWHQIGIEATVPKKADHMRLALIVHAHGTAWFDDVRLSHPDPQPAQAAFVLQPNKLITDQWLGFGSEGDLFLHCERVVKEGITDKDRELVRKRITAMRPKIVSLYFELREWEPEKGKRTPDSEAMKDLCETMALYKELGTDIRLREWGFPMPGWGWTNLRAPDPSDRRAFTDSFTSAVKYFREECGFTNLKYVSLYPEPNGWKMPMDDFFAMYRSLDESLQAAGIRKDVAIIAPDEANTDEYLQQAIDHLDDVIDYYSGDNYACDNGLDVGRWIGARIPDMPIAKSGTPPRKRFIMTEFGMHDGMDTFASTRNGEYDYGIFLADAAISAAKEGASGALMWCLMDTNYSQRMKWGLWKFKDEDWEPRPGFYSWSLLTRYTEKGSTTHPLVSNVSDAASVAFRAPNKGAWTLLLVNRRKLARQFTMTGLKPGSRWEHYTYSEESVPTTDREMIRPGKEHQADAHGKMKGTLPARSFVLWHEVMD